MTQERSAHRPGLDGLRGVAVVLVVAYHLGYLSGGFLGVDVFFVLSGYLITGLALREIGEAGSLSLRGFWGRRARRLIPALQVVVIIAVAVALLIGWPRNRLHDLAWNAISTLSWWANWRQAHGASYWTSGQNLFRHAWSLSIEEQFYVVWPVVLVASAAAAHRLRRSPAVVVGLVAGLGAAASGAWQVVLSHRLAVTDLSRVYVGTDTRAVAPLAGCALACALAGTGERRAHMFARAFPRSVTYVALVVLAVLVVRAEVSASALYRQGWLLVASLSAIVLVAAAGEAEPGGRDPFARAVTARPAQYLGSRSYGIYLWSWPTQVLIGFRWPGIAKPTLALVAAALSLGLAEISFRFVEQPLRRRADWATRPALRRPAWAAGVVAAVAVVAVSLAMAVPPPAHERIDTAEAAQDALRPPTEPAATATVPGDGPRPLRVMVTGDSLAWTVGYYKPDVDDLPPGIASIDSRAIIGCGLLSVDGWDYPQSGTHDVFITPGNGACRKGPEAERLGYEGRPDVVLLFPGSWEWSDARGPDGHVVAARSPEMASELAERLDQRIAAANRAGARMVIAAYSCPGSEAAGVRKDPAFMAWINRLLEGVVARSAAAGHRVELLRPTAEVCVDGDPLGEPTAAKVTATADEVHIVDAAGGRWIWHTWLGPALTKG